MPIPKVNVREITEGGGAGLPSTLEGAIAFFSEAAIAFFLEIVSERGNELRERFNHFKNESGGKASFRDFVRTMIENAEPIKLLYPKECLLDSESRQILIPMIEKQIELCDITSTAEIFQVYFGEGYVYEAARQASCKGCPQTKCIHNLQ